ncbi:MAG: fatty acid desaturase [Bacteroidia bacterium]|nr:fatty acid desaturase [Bacteroidia bacterium]
MASDTEKIRLVFKEIQQISREFKSRYPVFVHQDAIGMGIFLFSVMMILLGFAGYLNYGVHAGWVILWIAFWTSLLHELEHDLIHYLYFKKIPFLHNFMMLGVWVFRPLTVNPWFRRYLHLHHHKYSGLPSDLEERGVTNGEKFGLLRLFILPDLILSFVFRAFKLYPEIRKMEKEGRFTKEEVKNLYRVGLLGFLPFGIPLHLMWYSFALLSLLSGINQFYGNILPQPEWTQEYLSAITPIIVLLVAPNLLRQFSLHFITSNIHYYGDVEKGNIFQQTQILNTWWAIPFHLFCFNFGVTHAIHHFFVQETFYIRQLTAAKAVAVLVKYGVRTNDTGTFSRANRYHISG